ncbi:MAG TPA: ABC transporter ATP-binding protein, partial [Clostridia bacterium]|nr:ABC transporter ATP-binding protein [Clostridia bacterium]
MIQVRDLVKRYGDKAALNGVSFGIGAGEVVGLLGLNGAGKSTTMNILTGYLHMDSGSVKVGGFDLLSQPLKAKAQVGYMPEQPAFYGNMRVREYLNFICDLRGAARTRAARRLHVDDICARVGLEGMQNRLVRNLSKGYRQRVSFA